MGKRNLKIALVASFPPPYGGISNWALIVEKFGSSRDVDFININTTPVSRGLDGRTLYDRIVRQGIIMLKRRRELSSYINKEEMDAVHIATSGQLATIRDIMMLKLAKKKGIPTVYHLHFGRVPEIAKQKTKEWKLIKRAIALSDTTVAIDRDTFHIIQKYIPSAVVEYIPNPFDMSKIEAISPNLIERKKVITYVGWVVNTKGIEELMDAWSEIRKQYPEYILNIVGPFNEEYKAELKMKFDLIGVNFLGEKNNEEALRYIGESQIFILPSYTEGFPNVVLEAMALKTPVIATTVGAIPEMLSDNCGILIEPKDVVAIKDAVSYAIENQDKMIQQAENAYLKLIRQYEISVVFEQYRKVWGLKQ